MSAAADMSLHPKARRWSLEYLCNGWTMVWTGAAIGQAHADVRARQHLAESLPDFRPADAQLIKCVELPS